MSIGVKSPVLSSSRVVRQLFNIIDATGLSYGNVARIAGSHRNTLSYWKRGQRSPTLVEFENVLNGLGYELMIVRNPERRRNLEVD